MALEVINPKHSRRSIIFTKSQFIKWLSIAVAVCSGTGVPITLVMFPEHRANIELVIIAVGFIGSLFSIKGADELLAERVSYGDISNPNHKGIYKDMPDTVDKAKAMLRGSIEDINAIREIIISAKKVENDISTMKDSIDRVKNILN